MSKRVLYGFFGIVLMGDIFLWCQIIVLNDGGCQRWCDESRVTIRGVLSPKVLAQVLMGFRMSLGKSADTIHIRQPAWPRSIDPGQHRPNFLHLGGQPSR